MECVSRLVACAAVGCILQGATVIAQAPATARPAQLQTLPLTQLDERAFAADLDNRTFTLTFAQPLPIQDLLARLVRGTSLSVVAEPGISGSFIGELNDVTVRRALDMVLPPLGLDYSVSGGLIRVFHREPETRLFDINYVATTRSGSSEVGATTGGSLARVTSETSTDLFADIAKGVQGLLSEHATFNIDRKAGLLQATDSPERLDRIANYLDAVHDRVHRQVQIDVRVLEVELNDQHARSIDLSALVPGAVSVNSQGGTRLLLSGLNPGGVPQFLAALDTVGKVSLLADPHLLALNNETAIVHGAQGEQDISVALTPQIEGDGVVMLSLSPIVDLKAPPVDAKTPAADAVREVDTLARLVNGETLIMSGFSRDREIREKTGSGGGWFGRSTKTTTKHVALVVLLTPRIVNPAGAQ